MVRDGNTTCRYTKISRSLSIDPCLQRGLAAARGISHWLPLRLPYCCQAGCTDKHRQSPACSLVADAARTTDLQQDWSPVPAGFDSLGCSHSGHLLPSAIHAGFLGRCARNGSMGRSLQQASAINGCIRCVLERSRWPNCHCHNAIGAEGQWWPGARQNALLPNRLIACRTALSVRLC